MKDRIKAIRKSQNLTQADFASRLGIKGNTVACYETGSRIPSDAIIKAICREFDVSEKWLRTGDGEMFDSIPVDEDFLRAVAQIQVSDDKVIKSILLAYWELGDTEKNAIKKLVDNFWEKYKKNAGQ